MILEVEKKPKVALCRKCYGTGRLHDKETGKDAHVTNVRERAE